MIRNGVIRSVRDPPAQEPAVEEDREQRAEDERGEHGRDGHDDARPGGVPEERVVDQRVVVVEADELPRLRRHDRPVGEAVPDVQRERDLRHDDDEDQRRQEGKAPAPRPIEGIPPAAEANPAVGRGAGDAHRVLMT